MIIYVDTELKCHAESGEGLRAFDVPFFDGKCKAFIEGYIYVSAEEKWADEEGREFEGKMIIPWKNYGELAAAQAQYEEMLEEIEDMRNALVNELGVNPNG